MVGEVQASEVNKVQFKSWLNYMCNFKQITVTSPSLSFLIYKMCVNTFFSEVLRK